MFFLLQALLRPTRVIAEGMPGQADRVTQGRGDLLITVLEAQHILVQADRVTQALVDQDILVLVDPLTRDPVEAGIPDRAAPLTMGLVAPHTRVQVVRVIPAPVDHVTQGQAVGVDAHLFAGESHRLGGGSVFKKEVDVRILMLMMGVLLLGGCATTPTPTALARDVPLSRVFQQSLLKASSEGGQVIVKRDEGLSASACNSQIFVNGRLLAEISTGEKVVFYLPEGEHMLGAIAKGICIGGLVESHIRVQRSRPVIYRISYGSSGEFSLQPTAF